MIHPPVRRLMLTKDFVRAGRIQAGVSEKVFLSAERSRDIAWPRQRAMYLARTLGQRSLPAIGRAFGDRDHTTVLHAVRAVDKRRGISDSGEDELLAEVLSLAVQDMSILPTLRARLAEVEQEAEYLRGLILKAGGLIL